MSVGSIVCTNVSALWALVQKRMIPVRPSPRRKVRRSGQVTTFVVCAVFSLSFQAVVLLMKTAINHRGFLIWSEVSGWILKIPTVLVKELLLCNRKESFREFSSEVENALC